MSKSKQDEPLDAAIVDTPPPPAPPPTAGWRQALDNPWLVLGMLFFVTAALGLPFLWASRAFSAFWKVVLTIAVLAWTALILWLFWLVMVWCYTRIMDSLG